jgi:hypothetical protein
LYDPGYVRALAEEAAERPGWTSFATYCRLRGKGLRRDAFVALDAFIAEAVLWSLAERVAFALWVGERRRAYGGQAEAVLPVPLFRLLVRPTLEDWSAASPADPWPWVWLARLSTGGSTYHAPAEPYLREALKRDPGLEPARIDLIENLLRDVTYNQHELPWGYIGDAAEDVAGLDEAEAMMVGLPLEVELDLRPRVVLARKAARDWIAERGA